MTAPTTRKSPRQEPPTPPEADPNDTLGLTAKLRAVLEAEALYWLHLNGRPVTLGEMFEGFRPLWVAEALARCEAKGLVTAKRRGRDETKETAWQVTCAGLVELYETLTVEQHASECIRGRLVVRRTRFPVPPVF